MAIVSEEHGYLFVQVPRTGSTAIGENTLEPLYGGEFVGRRPTRELSGDKHASHQELIRRGLVSKQLLQRIYVFSTVRNPYDSSVSLYEKMRRTYAPLLEDPTSWLYKMPGYLKSIRVAVEASFSDWFIFHHTRRTPLALPLRVFRRPRPLPEHYRAVDRIMRFERLQQDFDLALADLGLPSVELPVVNVTKRDRDYRPYYDRRAKWLAERVFGNYRTHFGYEW